MVARLKLKEIDGRAPAQLETLVVVPPPPTVYNATTPINPAQLPTVLQHESGVSIRAEFILQNGQPGLAMVLTNGSSTAITSAELQFNLNAFGLQPLQCNLAPYPVAPGDTRSTVVPVSCHPNLLPGRAPPSRISDTIQVGLQLGGLPLLFFVLHARFYVVLQRGGVDETVTQPGIAQLYATSTAVSTVTIPRTRPPSQCLEILQQHGGVVTNSVSQPGLAVFQLYGTAPVAHADFAAELVFHTSGDASGSLDVTVRGRPEGMAQLVAEQIGMLCAP